MPRCTRRFAVPELTVSAFFVDGKVPRESTMSFDVPVAASLEPEVRADDAGWRCTTEGAERDAEPSMRDRGHRTEDAGPKTRPRARGSVADRDFGRACLVGMPESFDLRRHLAPALAVESVPMPRQSSLDYGTTPDGPLGGR